MKLFLDTSVLLAAAGSANGASRFLIASASSHGWRLLSSPYCLAEVDKNISKIGDDASGYWRKKLRSTLELVPDCVVLDKPLLFDAIKDKPVLITALAGRCEVLLTLDRIDFGTFFERGVYGLKVMTPGMFLRGLRA